MWSGRPRVGVRFAAPDDFGASFEGEDQSDFEIEIIPEGQEDPVVDDGKVTLTKEQFDELKRQTDSAGGMASQFAELAKELRKQGQPVNVPVQQKGETEEEFEKRLEEELYKPGNTGKTLRQAFERMSAGVVGQLQAEIADLRSQVSRVAVSGTDKEIMDKYGAEVQQLIGTLPVAQRGQAGAHQWALNTVKANHIDDIVAAKVAEAMAQAKPAEGGEAVKPVRQGPQMARGGIAAPANVIRVRPTAADYAAARGAYMSIQEYMAAKQRRMSK